MGRSEMTGVSGSPSGATNGPMARRLSVSGIVAGGLAVAGAATVVVGRRAWRRDTAAAIARLRDSLRHSVEAGSGEREAAIVQLPAPVARYFAFALPHGYRRIRAASIRWSGEFRTRPGRAWVPFTAVQDITSMPPGFVWDAQMRMLPLVPVHVRDSYRAGFAVMLGRIGGLVPVVDRRGTPELAQSALARWLGEAVWFPTALLPGDTAGRSVKWAAVNDTTARATVTDGATSASATFHFEADGALTSMSALRYRDVNGRDVPTPFDAQYRSFARREGFMVPMHAEVAWLLPEGRHAYWRGHPRRISYEF